MKSFPVLVFVLVALILLCAGCFTSESSQFHPTRDPNVFMKGDIPDEPRPGMTMRNVRLLWGDPDSQQTSGDEQVWFYERNGSSGLHMNYELTFAGERLNKVVKRMLDPRVRLEGNF